MEDTTEGTMEVDASGGAGLEIGNSACRLNQLHEECASHSGNVLSLRSSLSWMVRSRCAAWANELSTLGRRQCVS